MTANSAYTASILGFQSITNRLPSSLVAIKEVTEGGFPWLFSGAPFPFHLGFTGLSSYLSGGMISSSKNWYNFQMYFRQIKPLCVEGGE